MTSRAAELMSTYTLIECAFPEGVPDSQYIPLLAALYENMSDRNLAHVISDLTGKGSAEVLNDIYRIGAYPDIVEQKVLRDVLTKLRQCGYDEWLEED